MNYSLSSSNKYNQSWAGFLRIKWVIRTILDEGLQEKMSRGAVRHELNNGSVSSLLVIWHVTKKLNLTRLIRGKTNLFTFLWGEMQTVFAVTRSNNMWSTFCNWCSAENSMYHQPICIQLIVRACCGLFPLRAPAKVEFESDAATSKETFKATRGQTEKLETFRNSVFSSITRWWKKNFRSVMKNS